MQRMGLTPDWIIQVCAVYQPACLRCKPCAQGASCCCAVRPSR